MQRLLIAVFGSVQGVGIRPFIYRLAKRHSLVGEVKNTNNGVRIDVQGTSKSITHFLHDLEATKPARARIDEIQTEEAPLQETTTFVIAKSASLNETALALLPDTGICHECLKELRDPTDRRFGYPFLHCMTCGPRFSLFTAMPYDRAHTTMNDFTMCSECQAEYDDPDNRRFYSQTNCCPTCGPKLRLLTPSQEEIPNPLESAAAALLEGKIVALKNTGGYLLLADATNEAAALRLRVRKHRPKKPFALMMPSLESIEAVALLEPAARAALTSPEAPIVLLPKKEGPSSLARSVCPDTPYIGVMLPHSALHLLLFDRIKGPLIATSGNISDAPLCITEEEAFSELSDIADLFLVHNRRIVNRIDDSIVHTIQERPMLMRRARGFVPFALNVPSPFPPFFAAGGHQKNTFSWYQSGKVYPSQHMGDLDTTLACQSYQEDVGKWRHLLNISAEKGVHDSHPDYYTTTYIEKENLSPIAIQHHRAHVFAGMADQNLSPPLLAIAWDGSGYGDDHTIWGGEAFLVTDEGMDRFAHLLPFPLPGGELAIREPRRSALGALYALPTLFEKWRQEAFSDEEGRLLTTALKQEINAPLCSSIGRLFDAVSALLGCCLRAQYEGDAALSLEHSALKATGTIPSYDLPLLGDILDYRPLLEAIWADRKRGLTIPSIARAFHDALAKSIVALAQKANLPDVLLTGGVMQNRLLLEQTITRLTEAGFTPHWHAHIPPNDGGLSVGQVVAAIHQHTRRPHVSCPSC